MNSKILEALAKSSQGAQMLAEDVQESYKETCRAGSVPFLDTILLEHVAATQALSQKLKLLYLDALKCRSATD